jgi:hypothetical protein
VATLDDDELASIVQQKLQEIQSWVNRTQQWSLSPVPESSAPFAFAQPPVSYGHYQPQASYPAKPQEQAKQSTSSFANTDPSKVVEFKPRGLQLLTPTSPQSQECFASAPNEKPDADVMESVQDNAAFETTAGWTNLSNGDGWITPESNPGTNTKDKQPEEYTQGNESTVKFDWAEDVDRTFPISPLSWDISPPTRPTIDTEKGKGKVVTGNVAEQTSEWDWDAGGWDSTNNIGWGEPKTASEPEAGKEEPEVTKDMTEAWTAEFGISGGSWSAGTGNTADGCADGWDDPPKVAGPTGDISWGITSSNETWDTKGANESDWNTIPLKGKKSKSAAKKEKEKPLNSPPLTPKPKDKGNGFHKGQVEKDRNAWGKGWKEEESTTRWNSGKKGKKGGKPPPTPPPAKSRAITKTVPAKEKRTGPKEVFSFNLVTPPSSSAAPPQDTRGHEEGEPDLDSLPELPPSLKAEGYPLEIEKILRQAVVPKGNLPDRPSVAPLPKNADIDKGENWVNGTLDTGWNTDTPKDFSERKVQMDETSGWHPARVKRSNSKASPQMANKVESWPKLGK